MTATNNEAPLLSTLLAEKEAAEFVEREAKRLADNRRAEYAAALLADAFPGAITAVFARNWDEDAPRLIQILGTTHREIDTKISPAADASEQIRAQYNASVKAENVVADIGSDEAILSQSWFNDGDEEHDGWNEFNLGLDLGHSAD
jgi:hypothetical protein